MTAHGSASAALEALPEVARAAGVENYQICPEGVAWAELKAARAAGAHMLCHGAPDYPAALAQISDAPPIVWAIGQPAVLTRPLIAMVGARNASSLGLRMTKALAKELGEQGFAVVSGLARGIDTAAHSASLNTGTVAVLAGGADIIYPAENARLGQQITQTGLRLSEQPFGLGPQARHFPRRNRIISGLAQGLIVVEAAAKSGSLITAKNALDQGREVMAVPGHPFDARAAGCNMLIRDGARLIRSADDVIEALGTLQSTVVQPELDLPPPAAAKPAAKPAPSPPAPRPKRSLRDTAALHSQILQRLGPSPIAEDQLIRDLGGRARTVGPALTDLELDGKIQRQPGGLLSLVP
jgi:DNA processing protein